MLRCGSNGRSMSFLKTCTPNGGRARWRIKRHQQDGAARVFAQTSLPLRAWRGWVGVLGGLSLIAGTVVMISKADSQIEGVWKLQTFVVRTLKTFYTAVGVILDYKVTQIRNYFRAEEERYRDLAEFHSRSAQKILELCRSNGGICCKMEYIDTLKRLQDRCAPSTLDEAKEIFLEESGCSLEEYFSEFDVDPIGVATLAQVHLARLKTGERVAVKIQHKKLDAYVESDIKMAEKAIRLSEKLQPGLDLGWLVGGIKNSINEERDFVIEAKNMEDIRKISEINPVCVVPKVYYKSRRVLVMEYIDGARIDDRAYAKKNNINPRELSYELHKIFSQMVFYLGVIHSDPHPGNMLIRSADKASSLRKVVLKVLGPSRVMSRNFEIVLLDYGLCCRIDSDFQYQYAKLWKSIINADEYGIKKYSEKFFNKNISDIQPKSQIVVHRMFASMITGRSWQTISGFDDDRIEGSYIAGSGGAASLSLGRSKGIAQQRTDMEKEAIRRRMMERVYLDAMGTILSVINSEFLLILKTNDLLRSLDEIIGARDTEKSFLDVIILTAEHSSDAIYSEVKKRALFHMKTNILLKGLIDLGLPQTLMLLLSKTYWGALAEWWYMRALVSIPSFILALKGTCS